MSNYSNRVTFLLVFFFLWLTIALAQPRYNSPYSRLGLGDPQDANFVASASMGRLGATFHDPYMLNFVNPASLGFVRSTALEVGVFAETSVLENKRTGETANLRDGNLSYIGLGFPLRSPINEALDRKEFDFNWGMAFGLLPYTQVGYDIESTGPGPVDETGEILYLYEGSGSTYRLYWGNGWNYKNFSFGLNLQYVFGKLSQRNEELFLDLSSAYQNFYEEEFSINGFAWNAGAMYKLMLEKSDDPQNKANYSGKSLTFGLYGNGRTGFSTNSNQLLERLSGAYLSRDTFLFTEDIRGKGKLPAQLGVGLLYDDGKRIKLGVDAEWTLWSAYENEAKQEALSDVWKISGGLEWIPDHASYNNFFKRMRYHVGAYYQTDPRSVDGDQLNRYAGIVGLGLPIILKQDIAFINIKFEAGQFGLSEGLQETYYNFSFGFTLNDNTWFYKRKFR